MFLSVLAFFLGILTRQQCSTQPEIFALAILFVFLIISAFCKYLRVTFFLSGFLFASLFAYYHLSSQLLNDLQGKELLVQGNIIGLPEFNSRRVRFDFQITQARVPLPKKLRLSWYYPKQKITAGQRWQFIVKLKKPHGTLNPGGFDYEKWLFARHIGATGYIRHTEKAILLSTQPVWLSLSVARQALVDLLNQQVISPEARALVKALTLGDKSAISVQQWEVLSKTGTSHLMAISGLHIGLVAGLIYFFSFQCWLRTPLSLCSAPQAAAALSLIAAFLYAALAGFSIPTQRALLMLGMVMLTALLRRHVSTLNIFSLALLFVLLIDPLAVLSVGFYLSFLAVFFIMYVLSSRLGRQNRFLSSLKIHGIVGLGLLPILLFFFQSASMVSPLANMLAVPVVSFVIVPIALLAISLLPITFDFSTLLLQLVELVLQLLWQLLSYLSELSMANIARPKPEIGQMLVAMLGMLLLLAPKGLPGRYLGLLFIFPLFMVSRDKPEVGEVTLTLLDVGQGLSVVVQTSNQALVFDTGARFSDKFDMGSRVVVPFLQAKNITQLDMLIISHADNDHIGGAKAVLDTVPTEKILTSVPARLAQYHAINCYAGDSWEWDQVKFSILSPSKQAFKNENDNSCVLKIETKQGRFLLTGDIEAIAEEYLVTYQAEQLRAEVLIAPHHGSKTSSTEPFLRSVQPSIILIPADTPNRFSFPHTEVVLRYKQLGIPYWVTGEAGAIRVELKEDRITLETYRETQRYYWHTGAPRECGWWWLGFC